MRQRERGKKRDLVRQGCCVSKVVVEPLQCTKTKGREGVRETGCVETERMKRKDGTEERE